MPRIVPGLAEVRGTGAYAPGADGQRRADFPGDRRPHGRLLLAVLAVSIVSRRKLLWVFQIPGLIMLPIVFFLVPVEGLIWAQVGILFVGLATIAQFSFWGNYLPRVYPTYLRGTGESFAANVGGRMIGTYAALVTTALVTSMPGATVPIKLALGGGPGRDDRLRRRRHRQLLAARTEGAGFT